VLAACEASLAALKVEKVDLYYLHGPDTVTPLEETCDAIATLYERGCFVRWGLCNVSAARVKQVHAYCVRKQYVPPAVYQGVYNPLHRSIETELLPVLRELDMVFYAYSPLAGGVFAKPLKRILEPEKGDRFDVMPMFRQIYLNHPRAEEGLRRLAEVCEDAGLSTLEATMRWFAHHCALREKDGVIVGASSVEQLERSLSFKDGRPLDDKVVSAFEELWDGVKDAKPAFAFD